MVDFVEMRRRILDGEGDEPEISAPSPLNRELTDNRTRAIGAVGVAITMVALADRWKGIGLFKGKPDETTGEVSHDWLPVVIPVSLSAVAYAAGRITRGISCQERFDSYEELIQESETVVEEYMAEVEEEQVVREQAEAIEQENAWVFGGAPLIPSLSGLGTGSGLGTSTLGQEHIRYGPPSGDFQARTFGF
jgi:hypothetical protein